MCTSRKKINKKNIFKREYPKVFKNSFDKCHMIYEYAFMIL